LYKDVTDTLEKFRDAFIIEGHKEAYTSVKETWKEEPRAIKTGPILLDKMILTAIVDNRKTILNLTKKLRIMETKVNKLSSI
jgi:hypothetical protein